VPLESLGLGSAFAGSRVGLKERDLLGQSREFIKWLGPVGSETTSSTYTATIVIFTAGLCKVAWLQSLGQNRGEFREFTSITLSMAEANGHIVVAISKS
jgi:hypothetical protein